MLILLPIYIRTCQSGWIFTAPENKEFGTKMHANTYSKIANPGSRM